MGDYLPTAKNVLVEHHYEKLGFEHEADLPGGGTRWGLDLAEYTALPDLPMEMRAEEAAGHQATSAVA